MSYFTFHQSQCLSINKNAICLGKRDSKPCCLLKLTLDSTDERANILKHKLKLKAEQNSTHIHKLFTTPDLTPLEYRKNNALKKTVRQNKQSPKYLYY